ncbi:unnamed protein product, partial [Mesorhabditis spiculigera]
MESDSFYVWDRDPYPPIQADRDPWWLWASRAALWTSVLFFLISAVVWMSLTPDDSYYLGETREPTAAEWFAPGQAPWRDDRKKVINIANQADFILTTHGQCARMLRTGSVGQDWTLRQQALFIHMCAIYENPQRASFYSASSAMVFRLSDTGPPLAETVSSQGFITYWQTDEARKYGMSMWDTGVPSAYTVLKYTALKKFDDDKNSTLADMHAWLEQVKFLFLPTGKDQFGRLVPVSTETWRSFTHLLEFQEAEVLNRQKEGLAQLTNLCSILRQGSWGRSIDVLNMTITRNATFLEFMGDTFIKNRKLPQTLDDILEPQCLFMYLPLWSDTMVSRINYLLFGGTHEMPLAGDDEMRARAKSEQKGLLDDQTEPGCAFSDRWRKMVREDFYATIPPMETKYLPRDFNLFADSASIKEFVSKRDPAKQGNQTWGSIVGHRYPYGTQFFANLYQLLSAEKDPHAVLSKSYSAKKVSCRYFKTPEEPARADFIPMLSAFDEGEVVGDDFCDSVSVIKRGDLVYVITTSMGKCKNAFRVGLRTTQVMHNIRDYYLGSDNNSFQYCRPMIPTTPPATELPFVVRNEDDRVKWFGYVAGPKLMETTLKLMLSKEYYDSAPEDQNSGLGHMTRARYFTIDKEKIVLNPRMARQLHYVPIPSPAPTKP